MSTKYEFELPTRSSLFRGDVAIVREMKYQFFEHRFHVTDAEGQLDIEGKGRIYFVLWVDKLGDLLNSYSLKGISTDTTKLEPLRRRLTPEPLKTTIIQFLNPTKPENFNTLEGLLREMRNCTDHSDNALLIYDLIEKCIFLSLETNDGEKVNLEGGSALLDWMDEITREYEMLVKEFPKVK